MAASTKSQAQTKREKTALDLYKAAWSEASKEHPKRCARYDQAERAYRAELGKGETLGYQHDLRPHYCYETIDMLVAATIDDEAKVIVKPRQQAYEAGAKLHQKILETQRERDERTDKLTQLATHAYVYNVGVAKIGWDYYQREAKRRRWDSTSPAALAAGKPVEAPPEVEQQTVCNQPAMTVIDPRDFLLDPAARTIGEAAYCIARYHVTKQSLIDAGVYQNLDEVDESKGGSAESGSSAGKLKGRVTLCEYWTPERLIVVANDTVLVRDDEDVYAVGELPFIVVSPIPDLRSLLGGFSMAEVIAPLQHALWQSLNQRLDMATVTLNPPAWYDPNTFQGEKSLLQFGPGKRIPGNPNDGQWGVFEGMPTSVLAAAIQNAQPIRSDMHEIAAVEPFFAGAADQQTDPKTATQVNAIQSMVQLRMKKMRRAFAAQGRRAGALEVGMNKQLLREADVIRLDKGDAWAWQAYTLDDIQGDYDVVVSDEDENINQQKRREEASIMAQTLAPLIEAAPMNPALIPLIEMLCDAFDREDEKEEIVGKLEEGIQQQQQMQAAAAQAAMQPPPGAAPGGPLGPGAAASTPPPTTPFGAGAGVSLPNFAPQPPVLTRA